MEKLTEFRFEGTDRVQAFCEVCGKWIEQVGISKDCLVREGMNIRKVDYVYCQECNTAIARSS